MTDAASTASPTVAAPNSLDTFTDKQRSEWLRNGTPQPKEAESAPAKGESEPDKAEAIAPAADTGSQQAPKKGRADQRIQELLRERAELRSRLEAAEKKPAEKHAEPAAAAAAVPAPAAQPNDGKPVAPDPTKWTGTWEELEAAKIKYFEDLTDWKLKQPERDRMAAAKAADEANQRAAFDAWKERRDAMAEAEPEFADANDIVGRFLTAKGVAPLIIESEVGPEIVMHLYRLPKEEQERVSKLSPTNLARELVRIEDQLGKPADEEERPPAPAAPKKTSAAAKPATELSGTHATNTGDEAEAAIVAGDSAAYQRIMNARDLQRRKQQ